MGEQLVDSGAPTLDELGRLYAASGRFFNKAPWRWMVNEDLFGVHDPASGLTGYACVMGTLGEVFGLAVYPGAHGYDCYRRAMAGAAEPADFETVARQDCLLASFEDRESLESP